MKTFTMTELTERFLHITKKIEHVVQEKNWTLLNHYLIERNDVIEFIEERKSELSSENLRTMNEAWNIQVAIIYKMEEYRSEILDLHMQALKYQIAGRKYLEQQHMISSTNYRYK